MLRKPLWFWMQKRVRNISGISLPLSLWESFIIFLHLYPSWSLNQTATKPVSRDLIWSIHFGFRMHLIKLPQSKDGLDSKFIKLKNSKTLDEVLLWVLFPLKLVALIIITAPFKFVNRTLPSIIKLLTFKVYNYTETDQNRTNNCVVQ